MHWVIWIAFYSYCVQVAVLFKQTALPYLAPSLHGGNGLLHHDSLYFHGRAKIIAEAQGQIGWPSWSTELEKKPVWQRITCCCSLCTVWIQAYFSFSYKRSSLLRQLEA